MNFRRLILAVSIAAAMLIVGSAVIAQDVPTPNTITGSTFVTATRPFSDDLLEQLTLPEGFTISVFARDLGNARMIAIGEDGTIYVSRRSTNDVIALSDADGDGVADSAPRVVASDIPLAHGLAIQGSQLYIAGEKQIFVTDIQEDGALNEPTLITDGLPDGDQHGARTIQFAPDGQLYVNLGSSCNACLESNPENATITRVPLDGSARTIVAEGVRNSLGFAWHPETGALWAFDHGSDWRGDDQPPEELNQIVEGSNYGWPICYGMQEVDVYIPYNLEPIEGITNEEFCAQSAAPVLTYQAHSAPISFIFYTSDQFPAEYQNDAFVTMRGSWNRYPATGYSLVHVNFEDGQPTEITEFVSGFLIEDGTAHFARPAGLAQMADGSLLMTDDTNGMMYRITYTGM